MPETVSPSPSPADHSCWLPRHDKSPRAARRELRSFLRPHPCAELLLPTAELLVSELVTNALQHARTPRDRLIFVRFQLSPDDTLRIEVHDADSEKPTLRDSPASAETGRGLLLVHELAHSWGCDPRTGGVGKLVWCHVSPEGVAA
ncbi:anti-sigma regulatory factor (Ser/Thr protein kinase) [Streptomyces sp. 1114.5]|uniref:ATP-binding protein n=1 Tax=Streptomyces sp. 1114.5 TaxID=1938830 RepID=UPI000F283B48|nr:ATP-binding protein [Streptomyces sp. 1114.5]RKT15992.1 anti-sigma regulatory factor (Ser/Thr protein kinase) [Streptomyces sp. 1114.5]